MAEKDATKNEQDMASPAGEDTALPLKPDGDTRKEAETVTVVLKLDLHCEGCAKKVRRFVTLLEGITKVRADCGTKKLTVTGNVDPTWIRDTVANKTKKKVELISPQPKTDTGAAPPAADGKVLESSEDKPEENKSTDDNEKPKAMVMKMKLHCEGCAQKIKRVILKNIDGVDLVTTDLQKNLITVVGTMDVSKMIPYLQEKLKRNVDIMDPTKIDEGKIKIKQETSTTATTITMTAVGGSEEKREEGGKEEIKKMESKSKVKVNKMETNHDYNLEIHHVTTTYDHTSMYTHQLYNDATYTRHYVPLPPPPTYLTIDNDQMFSDENPNGCVVM